MGNRVESEGINERFGNYQQFPGGAPRKLFAGIDTGFMPNFEVSSEKNKAVGCLILAYQTPDETPVQLSDPSHIRVYQVIIRP